MTSGSFRGPRLPRRRDHETSPLCCVDANVPASLARPRGLDGASCNAPDASAFLMQTRQVATKLPPHAASSWLMRHAMAHLRPEWAKVIILS